MRKEIEPKKEVTRAWQTRKAMLKEAGANFFINSAQIMSIADRLLRMHRWKQAEEEAEILFLQAVIRHHGHNTVVEIKNGEFALFQLDEPPRD